MQQVAGKSLGVRLESLPSRAAHQTCRPRRGTVVAAAHQHDKQLPQMTVAAAAAALLLSSAQPATAGPGPTLFESNEKNVQELQDIIAARGKGLPDLIDVPEAKEAIKAAKDVPLEKIQGVIRKTQDALPDSVPNPLPPSKNPLPAVNPQDFVQSAPQAVKEAPKAASEAVKQAAPSAPSLPSAPALPEGPSQTTILGAVAVVVAGGAAIAAAGKQGELPSAGNLQAGASEAAGAAKDAASKTASKAESAAEKAPSSAEEAQEAAKQSASEAREWIKNWRDNKA